MPRASAIVLLGLVALAACGEVPPYRRMGRAARSERKPFTQVEDRLLVERVRSALGKDDQLADADITPYVYMGHVFLVGPVDHSDQQGNATKAVQDLEGVRSVEAYLPVKSGDARTASAIAGDAAIQVKVKAALALAGQAVTRVDVQVLDGHVVLLGVVKSQEAVSAAVTAARGVGGVTGVTNFLLLPEPGYETLRSEIL
jgi:hyperosmotically inducible protein